MTVGTADSSPMVLARVAGLLYLVIIVCGISGEAFIRSGLIVPGDAAATAANIRIFQGLFRASFAADAVMLLCDVAIAVLFYVLLRPAGRTLALVAAAFRLTQAAVLGLNLLNQHAAVLVLGGAGYAGAFTPDQLNALALLFLDLHSHGYDLGLLFFGLSCLALGRLVVRSVLFPGVFGYGLMAAGAVYLAGSFTRFLLPDLAPAIAPLYIVPLAVETAFALWLTIRGVRSCPGGAPTAARG
ncbi:MAG: DUF4386 domain-containing protein [Gammaproteobacteria bacterium]|nr:DUF4386 domain-containing protein [Gammaproteobacteria bacterium]